MTPGAPTTIGFGRLTGVLLAAALVAGCATGTSSSGDAGASPPAICEDDCRLEVRNRLDHDVNVYLRHDGGYLGTVPARDTRTFDLPHVRNLDIDSGQLQVWIGNAETQERGAFVRVRRWRKLTGILLLEP